MHQSDSETSGSLNISSFDAAEGKRVLVLGAGFGGIEFCRHFQQRGAQITLVDRTNHFLFQPLLYQVATAGLAAPDIAEPVRAMFHGRNDITVLMDEVVDFDLHAKTVFLRENTLPFDYLVVAMGGCNSYFGNSQWEQFAPGLKTLDDALRLRSRILVAFEKAENHQDKQEREKLMTIVIVGGGPTGVEMAGACAELTRTVLRRDFKHIDSSQARIILVEGQPVVLDHFPADLSHKAQRQLEVLGVQVKSSTRVKQIHEDSVELATGEIIQAGTIIWAAGVSAASVSKKLGVDLDKHGRVKVQQDLSVPGHPEIFAIGDIACVTGADGKPVPGVAPAAMQMGRHVAALIRAEIQAHGNAARPPFKYYDKGTMAAIGRSSAVAWRGKVHLSGYPAWLMWLFVHLLFLTGLHNRLAVLFQWFYSYVFYKRGARIINNELVNEPAKPEAVHAGHGSVLTG